jgi:hypothetical protein
MLQSLLDQMDQLGVLLAPDDVADALWLTNYLPVPKQAKPGERWQGPVLEKFKPFRMPSWLDALRRLRGGTPRAPQRAPEARSRHASAPRPAGPAPSDDDAIAVAIVDPGLLGNATDPLLRTLRLLRRSHASRTRLAIDVERTIARLTETGNLLPVEGPLRELWLEAVLVVDATPSAFLWRTAADELLDLLVHSGAFRSVRRLELHPGGRLEQQGRAVSPRGLIDPEARTLVLIVTDAVDALWYDGTAARLLNLWARSLPVLLVHWLPERLWAATAIGRSRREAVKCSPEIAGGEPRRVPSRRLGRAGRRPDGPAIPVTTLSPRSLRQWARMLTKRDGTSVSGVVLPLDRLPEPTAVSDPVSSPEELVQAFDVSASLDARRLLRMLAGVPLTLPVIRVVRSSLLPGSDPSVVAEVLLSGLIEQLEPGDPEAARFGFRAGIPEILLEHASAIDLQASLRAVAGHLGVQFGGRSFDAALDASELKSTEAFDPNAGAFALAAAPVLKRLGGRYRRLAAQLDSLQSRQPSRSADSSLQEAGESSVRVDAAGPALDLQRVSELPPDAVVEVAAETAPDSISQYLQAQGIYDSRRWETMDAAEFEKGIQDGRFKWKTSFRIRGASSPSTQLGETLLYCLARRKAMNGPVEPKPEGDAMICRALTFKSSLPLAARIARILPKKTKKLSECVIFITRAGPDALYTTTNFSLPGYECPTKIHSCRDIDLATILLNSVADEKTTFQEHQAIEEAHYLHVRYVVDRHALDPERRPWLYVDPNVNVQYVRELEDVVGVAPSGDRYPESVLHIENKQYHEACRILEEMIAEGNLPVGTLNSLAWHLATSPEASLRDPAGAVTLAEAALRPDPNDPNILDTFAAALAAAGRFQDAVQIQALAAKLTTKEERTEFLERLELYRSNKPYVQG